ncbi:DNA cytosine methyltransferase [Gimibacter soli]|uniref:Cytosine-specific methyltransferase n=1 Tax=Gimibacter soli TaxID=3024400 RepID=A0AAE9XPM8_9PROT|nr:DNA cytosine methyltransferase [Gimibacter soli]WCL54852.1 DNA cytosine methyltransferase [Gimibacter soli]
MALQKSAIDLFCGAGGLSEGFRQAGYHVLAGNDLFPAAGETYKLTHKEAEFIDRPIQDVTANDLLKAAGLRKGELSVLLGGPPCQAYSVYNHQRGMHDERASLFKEYLRIVEGTAPEWVVMENVTGITSIAGGGVVETIKAELRRLGYHDIDSKILKAEDYGVPQERRRIFFIANRLGIPVSFPNQTYGNGGIPFTSIWDAIGDLPELENGEKGIGLGYACRPLNAYQASLREEASALFNHSSPKLGAINVARMKHIPIGGSWRDIPLELLPEGMKRAKRSDHTKRYGRMRPDGLSCTILTKCDVHWGAYIHPFQDRAITVREAARLQSFPDFFDFQGSQTEQYVQVGNAVPPLLGRSVALQILEMERAQTTGIAAE